MVSLPTSAATERNPRAVLAILAVTVLWGWTFVWMKQAVLESERVLGAQGLVAGVGLFMTLRFGLAALVLAAWPQARRGLDAGAWRGGLWIGALLLAGFLLQMFGLQGVSAPVSAFLTSLYVVFTALFLCLRTRKPPDRWLGLGALLATLGAGFIGGPPHLTFGLAEWLTVGCAAVFALHILATDEVTRRHAPLPVTLTTFVWVTLGSAAFLIFGCCMQRGPSSARLIDLAGSGGFLVPLVLSSLLATVLALSLINLFQRRLDPVRAAILYAIEPVWAAMIALGLGMARADEWLWIGGGALLAGNLAAELGPLLAGRRPVDRAGALVVPDGTPRT